MTTNQDPRTDATARLAWEDARIAVHTTAGHDTDEALRLTILDWCALTGENPDEL